MSASQPAQEYATPPITTANKLRKFLNESNDIVVAPGVYDGFSARIALQVGFDALYMVRYSSYSSYLSMNRPHHLTYIIQLQQFRAYI